MSNTKNLYFRPIHTQYIEEGRTNGVPTYTILVKVAYFHDEAMENKAFEEDRTFEKVTYTPDWDGALATVYTLINK